ncbi:MAG: NAD-dependent epimerase/dehydratase family protein, partial [Verrucomicrobiae bacterium]|nr:NAD-dependent epimerase/dehydratase family protein [Verrucomicrobiae bacterium]
MNARRILITGGAGFIGCNAARYFRKRGWEIVLWDNLSRSGGESNLEW